MIKRANTVKTSKSAGSRSLKTESSRIRDENRKKNKMVVQAGLPADYTGLVESIRDRVRKAQVKANLSVNRELVILYWEIGSLIVERQKKAGWGTGVIPSLARDLKSQLPGLKGFSERNLNRMTRFYDEYGQQFSILPQPVAKLQEEENSPKYVDLLEQGVILPQAVAKLQSGESGELQNLVFSLPWGHNILLIEKVKELDKRLWYMKKTIEHGWSRNVLALQIETDAYMRKAQAVTNFHLTLPDPLSDLAQQTLKDPYIFDFLTLDTKFRERELEMGLREQLEKFLLELGAGFAYVGKQVVLKVSQE